jgi:GH24 family phage-related lysozyme (muramidase)
MRPSEKALTVIKNREKLRLTSYRLPGEKHYTIGWGHYCDYSDKRNRQWDRPGATITRAEADALLKEDVEKKTNILNSLIPAKSVPQDLYDALVSTVYQYNPKNKYLGRIFQAINMGTTVAAVAKMLLQLPSNSYNKKARKVDAILATTGEVKHIDEVRV